MKIVLFLIMAIFAYLSYKQNFADIFLNIALLGFLITSITFLFIKTEKF